MTSLNPAENTEIQNAITSRKLGHSLPREFYSGELIYRADVERVWRRGWLFAGHTCQIPEPGDYFTFDIDTDSLIVVRDDEENINAFHNLCRHRRLCYASRHPAKSAGLFVLITSGPTHATDRSYPAAECRTTWTKVNSDCTARTLGNWQA